MPGTVRTVRILMFIGAVVGLLLAVVFGLIAASDEPFFLILALGVFGLYGVGSLVLAILAGRRHPAIRWTILAFHVAALVYLIAAAGSAPDPVPGEPDPGRSLRSFSSFFTLANIILISLPVSGRYYRKSSDQRPAPAGYGPGPARDLRGGQRR